MLLPGLALLRDSDSCSARLQGAVPYQLAPPASVTRAASGCQPHISKHAARHAHAVAKAKAAQAEQRTRCPPGRWPYSAGPPTPFSQAACDSTPCRLAQSGTLCWAEQQPCSWQRPPLSSSSSHGAVPSQPASQQGISAGTLQHVTVVPLVTSRQHHSPSSCSKSSANGVPSTGATRSQLTLLTGSCCPLGGFTSATPTWYSAPGCSKYTGACRWQQRRDPTGLQALPTAPCSAVNLRNCAASQNNHAATHSWCQCVQMHE